MRRVGFVRFTLVRLGALALALALLFAAFQYYIIGIGRDLTSFIPAEFGQPILLDKQIEMGCFSALYSLESLSQDEIGKALASDHPTSRGLLKLEEALKKSRGFSVGEVFEKFSNQRLADDNSYRASVVTIGAGCGSNGKRSVKDDIVRDVFAGDRIFHAFGDGDHTVMLVDPDRRLLLLASW